MTDVPAQTDDPASPGGLRAMLKDIDRRLVRAVDAASDDVLAEPSRLAGWSRAHVVAHLALNGEALAGVVEGALAGVPVPMYSDPGSRDGDIEALTTAGRRDAGVLRTRLLGATGAFAAAADRLDAHLDTRLEHGGDTADLADLQIERTPGSGRTFRLGDVLDMRLREVEVHHVDLDLGLAHRDLSPVFACLLIDAMVALRADAGPAELHASDVGRRWALGDGRFSADPAPVVSGPAAELAWWLSGRGAAGLTGEGGDVPELPAWG